MGLATEATFKFPLVPSAVSLAGKAVDFQQPCFQTRRRFHDTDALSSSPGALRVIPTCIGVEKGEANVIVRAPGTRDCIVQYALAAFAVATKHLDREASSSADVQSFDVLQQDAFGLAFTDGKNRVDDNAGARHQI